MISETRLRPAISVLSWLIFAGGLLTIGAAAYITYAAYTCLPTYDAWSVPDYLATHTLYGHRATPLQYLWAQYNEHRILIPKLFLVADWQLFRGTDRLAIASILGIRLLDLAVLLWVFRRFGDLRGAPWRTVAGIAAVCLFSTSQYQNFESGFQIAFMLPGLFVHLALVLLLLYTLRQRTKGAWKDIVALLGASAAATYSLAAGILVWPLILLTAVWLRTPKRVIAVITAVSAVIIASYLYHYHSPPGHTSPLTAMHHPLALAAYVATYLGTPWVWGSFRHPVVFGCLGLVSAAAAIGRVLAQRNADSLVVMFTAVLLFDVGTSVLTALGRVGFGAAQSSSSRYETFSLVFWLSLAVLLLHHLAKGPGLWFAAAQASLLVAMIFAGMHINLQEARDRGVGVNSAALAMLSGVFDHDVLLYHVTPGPESIWATRPFLRQHHLSIFATDLARHLNGPVQSVYRLRKEHCWGQLLRAQPVGDAQRAGLRLSGWTWDPVRRRPVQKIVLESNGKIIGYGQPGWAQPRAVFLVGSRSAFHSGWIGYVKTAQQDSTGRIYGVLDLFGKRICLVDGWPQDAHGRVEQPLQFSIPSDSSSTQ